MNTEEPTILDEPPVAVYMTAREWAHVLTALRIIEQGTAGVQASAYGRLAGSVEGQVNAHYATTPAPVLMAAWKADRG